MNPVSAPQDQAEALRKRGRQAEAAFIEFRRRH
jgi:hypothetical protein